MKNSPYLPETVKVKRIKDETIDVKTITLDYKPEFKPGQFFEVGLAGTGEAPFTVASAPNEEFSMSIKNVGRVSGAIHNLRVGDELTIRGPYGNGFPYDKFKGHNLLFIGGGIGLPPLRSLINKILGERKKFGKIHILYGAKDETQIVSKEDLAKIWPKSEDVKVDVCVDRKTKECAYPGHVCLIPDLIDKVFTENEIENTFAVICGPPIMMKFAAKRLLKYGFDEENIITTLERQVRCGFGKCGHCNIGEYYICLDGPVFDYKQIKNFIEEI